MEGNLGSCDLKELRRKTGTKVTKTMERLRQPRNMVPTLTAMCGSKPLCDLCSYKCIEIRPLRRGETV
jgi:hypothetical protein